jgi:hypothetical protein
MTRLPEVMARRQHVRALLRAVRELIQDVEQGRAACLLLKQVR